MTYSSESNTSLFVLRLVFHVLDSVCFQVTLDPVLLLSVHYPSVEINRLSEPHVFLLTCLAAYSLSLRKGAMDLENLSGSSHSLCSVPELG